MIIFPILIAVGVIAIILGCVGDFVLDEEWGLPVVLVGMILATVSLLSGALAGAQVQKDLSNDRAVAYIRDTYQLDVYYAKDGVPDSHTGEGKVKVVRYNDVVGNEQCSSLIISTDGEKTWRLLKNQSQWPICSQEPGFPTTTDPYVPIPSR